MGESVDFGDDPSVGRLMGFLKTVYDPRNLDDIEEILTAREKKWEDEMDLLKEENGRLRSYKLDVEAELKDLKELVVRVNGDRTAIQERERELLEEVHKREAQVTEFRTQITELENNKSKAEASAAEWKNRFEALESRISQLENDAELLKGVESPISTNIEEGLDDNCSLLNQVKTGADCNENPCQVRLDKSRDAGSKGDVHHIFVEISDTDDDEGEKSRDDTKRGSLALKRKQDPQAVNKGNAQSSKQVCLRGHVLVERSPQSGRRSSSDSDSDQPGMSDVKSCRKWKNQIDMALDFHKDPELCMDAICALYRRKILAKYDATRARGLAEFLIDGDEDDKRRKSKGELIEHDKNGIVECEMIASLRYREELFNIFQNQEDPFYP